MPEYIIKFDSVCNDTERFLSNYSNYPVAGTPFGLVKIFLGSFQLTTALALSILTIPLQCTEYAPLNDYIWTHVGHGFGNICAGIVEAIPILASFLYADRQEKGATPHAQAGVSTLFTTHEDKYMAYHSLEENEFILVISETDQSIRDRYEVLLKAYPASPLIAAKFAFKY